ncbi:hypothetical protein [Apilactobacillus ozensis]|uniref:hypothetical protein n=1 Tax=Apilactobacillus ozensis TaxID=866801 RepID=UPI000A75F382|nr:hypothetical protein [Apilactobacillus ozensis]
MSGYFASIDHRLFKNVNIISRHILFNIRKHNYAKAIRQMKLIIALRYTHKILRNKGRGITRAYYEVICKKIES